MERTSLEENEIHNLRDVDTRIEHIDGDRDVRRLSRNREAVDQALRVFDGEVDQSGELASVFGVVLIEPLGDEDGVRVVLREDDRFPETIAAGHF